MLSSSTLNTYGSTADVTRSPGSVRPYKCRTLAADTLNLRATVGSYQRRTASDAKYTAHERSKATGAAETNTQRRATR